MKPNTIYQDFIDAGCEVSHYESDLYVQDSTTARDIITSHDKSIDGWNVRFFRSSHDGKMWIDLPFCYAPHWPTRKAVRS